MQKLIFLGDSITDAGHLWEAPPLGQGYVRLLADSLPRRFPGIRVINKGQDGFTAARVLQSLDRNCLKLGPDAVSLLVGINDVAAALDAGLSLEALGFGPSLEQIFGSLLQAGISRIFCMGPFAFSHPAGYLAWFPVIEEAEQLCREAAQSFGIPFLPLHARFQEAAGRLGVEALSVDGVHLTQKGHALLAEWWEEAFIPEG